MTSRSIRYTPERIAWEDQLEKISAIESCMEINTSPTCMAFQSWRSAACSEYDNESDSDSDYIPTDEDSSYD